MAIGYQEYIKWHYPAQRLDYAQWKMLQHGPKIVVIGGGTGLSVLLRGLKQYSSNLTAVVSVGDDGGSSGRIREEFGLVPVGDIRNCIVALSNQEDLMEQIFDYRFKGGEGLEGHSLGNLLLVAMAYLKGNFQDAVSDINQVLRIRGQVLPVSDEPITLKAFLDDGTELVGETCVSTAQQPIRRLIISPEDVQPLPEVLQAIGEADAIVLGPGSLYTSIIPNLLVDGIVEAIQASAAMKFYICNVMTQAGETDDFTAEDHLFALLEHSQKDVVNYIVVNNHESMDERILQRYAEEGAIPVKYHKEKLKDFGVQVLEANLLNEQEVLRHDSGRLAAVLLNEIFRRSPLRQRWRWRKINRMMKITCKDR